MSIQLPPKPWKDGDTFVNSQEGGTDVEYTYDGVKWIASGGGEADEATLDFINEVDRTSQMRDEAIEQQHKQDEALNTAAHLRMEQQIVRIGTWSEADDDKVREEFAKADSELQAQIDAIESPEGKYLPLSGGEMTGPAVLKVNHIEPVNTPMIQYNGDPNSTHAAGLINRYMMTNYVTEELAKVSSGSPELPKFKLMASEAINNWDLGMPSSAGDLAFLNVSGAATDSIFQTRSIVFAGKDITGRRCVRDKDAIDYRRMFGTAFSVLNESGEKIVLSMSGSHNALCEVFYISTYEGVFYDMYKIAWQSPTSTAVTSDVEKWVAGETYQLHIPELFF